MVCGVRGRRHRHRRRRRRRWFFTVMRYPTPFSAVTTTCFLQNTRTILTFTHKTSVCTCMCVCVLSVL